MSTPDPEFRALYDAHFDFVWRSLRRLGVREPDVLDLAQKVFLTAHLKLAEFEGRSRITTWLFGICQRVASDHRRSAPVRREVATDAAELERASGAGEAAAVAQLEARQRARLAEAILDKLPEAQRVVFVLFELEEMSGEEIAELLAISVGTVRSRLRLAREAFAREVKRCCGRGRRPQGGRVSDDPERLLARTGAAPIRSSASCSPACSAWTARGREGQGVARHRRAVAAAARSRGAAALGQRPRRRRACRLVATGTLATQGARGRVALRAASRSAGYLAAQRARRVRPNARPRRARPAAPAPREEPAPRRSQPKRAQDPCAGDRSERAAGRSRRGRAGQARASRAASGRSARAPRARCSRRRARELRGGDAPRRERASSASRRSFPRGVLLQEREVLAIEVLAAQGDAAAAQRRARAFVKAHPESPHSAKLRRFLAAVSARRAPRGLRAALASRAAVARCCSRRACDREVTLDRRAAARRGGRAADAGLDAATDAAAAARPDFVHRGRGRRALGRLHDRRRSARPRPATLSCRRRRTSPPTTTPGAARARYRAASSTRAGDYVIWGRIHAPGADHNRFWFQLDGGTWYKWRISVGEIWYWDDFHDDTDTARRCASARRGRARAGDRQLRAGRAARSAVLHGRGRRAARQRHAVRPAALDRDRRRLPAELRPAQRHGVRHGGVRRPRATCRRTTATSAAASARSRRRSIGTRAGARHKR